MLILEVSSCASQGVTQRLTENADCLGMRALTGEFCEGLHRAVTEGGCLCMEGSFRKLTEVGLAFRVVVKTQVGLLTSWVGGPESKFILKPPLPAPRTISG